MKTEKQPICYYAEIKGSFKGSVPDETIEFLKENLSSLYYTREDIEETLNNPAIKYLGNVKEFKIPSKVTTHFGEGSGYDYKIIIPYESDFRGKDWIGIYFVPITKAHYRELSDIKKPIGLQVSTMSSDPKKYGDLVRWAYHKFNGAVIDTEDLSTLGTDIRDYLAEHYSDNTVKVNVQPQADCVIVYEPSKIHEGGLKFYDPLRINLHKAYHY